MCKFTLDVTRSIRYAHFHARAADRDYVTVRDLFLGITYRARASNQNPKPDFFESVRAFEQNPRLSRFLEQVRDDTSEDFFPPLHSLDVPSRKVIDDAIEIAGVDAVCDDDLRVAILKAHCPTIQHLLTTHGIAVREDHELLVNLNRHASQGKLAPVFGRNDVLERAFRTLLRRRKNNPLFLGEPGVGKTAIVEAIAYMIYHGLAPPQLSGVVIYALNPLDLIQATTSRGDVEERVASVVAFMRQRPDAVLFIDEIHTIANLGTTELGGMSVSDMLKPLLARSALRCIGSTTQEEYKTIFARDLALERRFQPIDVEAMDPESTLQVLLGARETYEKFHRCRFETQTLERIVRVAHRYLPGRYFPDKAIDLLDELGSIANVPHRAREEKLQEALRLEKEMRLAADAENYDLATAFRNRANRVHARIAGHIVTPQHVDALVEAMTGIRIRDHSAENLEPRILERVFGQDVAVSELCDAVRRNAAGIRDPRRPVGSFLLIGPPGVGKTHLSLVLSHELFGTTPMRLDMSEFVEPHSIARLIGSPPGYEYHGTDGELGTKIRNSPGGVMLVDQFDKAHSAVQSLFLQVIDEGYFHSARGRRIDCRNCMFVFTSSRGTDAFAPELVNRFDGVLHLSALSKRHIERIVDETIHELNRTLTRHGAPLVMISERLSSIICSSAGDGPRAARNAVCNMVIDQLAEYLLSRHAPIKGTLLVDEHEIRLLHS